MATETRTPNMPPGFLSLKAFAIGLGLCLIPSPLVPGLTGWLEDSLVFGVTGLIFMCVFTDRQERQSGLTNSQIRTRAFFLGWGFSCGFRIVFSGYSTSLGLYICLLCFFHYTEFFTTSFTSPETLSLDSFLLNHSKEYGIAAVASVIEFFLEFWFIPWIKSVTWITYFGLALCLGGEFLRKWAMFTASSNFTHLVRERKAKGQYLVTTGPYALFRHPGYAGWFLWSIGTQFVMVNPICIIGYYFAVLRFFRSRIHYEEICLLSFFGLDYVEYQKNVPRTGVPFVPGYLITMQTIPNQNDVEETEDNSNSESESSGTD